MNKIGGEDPYWMDDDYDTDYLYADEYDKDEDWDSDYSHHQSGHGSEHDRYSSRPHGGYKTPSHYSEHEYTPRRAHHKDERVHYNGHDFSFI